MNLAKALVESLLTDELPTLSDYLEPDTGRVDATAGASPEGAVSED